MLQLVVFTSILWGFAGEAIVPDSWSHKTLREMSLDEKIGQLFMLASYVDPEFAAREMVDFQSMDSYIEQYHIGAIAYVGPSQSVQQVLRTNHYQKLSKYPLLIAQDLEWGLSMRLRDGLRFPKNITLGTLDCNDLIYELGKEIGRQARCIGVHMNLSPVLDVNTEPDNPVINVRSFGSSPEQVAEKGVAMIRGIQDGGVIASAKHFPGLGNISVDPHLALPVSDQSQELLEKIELLPFARAIEAGVLSIQTEHLLLPSIDPQMPASLSVDVVRDLLQKKMGFQGLVLSGALRMKALTNHFSQEEIVLKAFLAGSDMLLMPEDIAVSHRALKMAVAEGKILEKMIDERVLKILQLKEKMELAYERQVEIPRPEQLHSSTAKELKKKLYREAVCLFRDEQQLVPLQEGSIAYVQLGEAPSLDFLDTLRKSVDLHLVDPEDSLDPYSLIILAVYPLDPRRMAEIRLLEKKQQVEELKHFNVHGISASMKGQIDLLQCQEKKTIVAFFGNPFGIHYFDGYSTFLMGYETDVDAQCSVADILIK